MKFFKKSLNQIQEVFINLETNCKFLIILIVITFPVICLSIFNPNLDATGNLVTIRTSFSTLVGYILQKSTCTINSESKIFQNKTILVGLIAIVSLVVVIFSYIFSIDVNNPSLILIKNLLFSSIGFLTSSTKDH